MKTKTLLTKLRSTDGDTMAESLVAILIAAMAAAALAVMVLTATNIVNKNSDTMNAIYSAESSINTASSSGSVSPGVTVESSGIMMRIHESTITAPLYVPVTIYEDTDQGFIRYVPDLEP